MQVKGTREDEITLRWGIRSASKRGGRISGGENGEDWRKRERERMRRERTKSVVDKRVWDEEREEEKALYWKSKWVERIEKDREREENSLDKGLCSLCDSVGKLLIRAGTIGKFKLNKKLREKSWLFCYLMMYCRYILFTIKFFYNI